MRQVSHRTIDDASRADDLFQPSAGDPGAHGRFGDRATPDSPLLWAEENRTPLFAAVAATGTLAVR